MPRTVAQETIAKIEYVKNLYAADSSLTRRDLNAAVKKRFKTGLAFGHMANVLEGGRRPGGPRKPGAAPAGAGTLFLARKTRSGRPLGLGRMARVTDRIFADRPAFLVIVGREKALRVRSADSKAAVKEEIARLVSAGAHPSEISVYSRDAFSVETRPIVNMD